MATKLGIVVKSVGGVFTVRGDDGNKYVCFAPKKLRYNDLDLVVGDRIKFDDIKRGKGVVNEIIPRKNKLTRPEIANVDVCFIVLACEPQPDLYLCDKLLINCFQEKIEPIIVVNKMDVSANAAEQVKQNYASVTDIICVSALDNASVMQLTNYLKDGKVACFAGQSAVGKTSILNALLPNFNGATGGLSAKSGRGMHTTRHSELHAVGDGYIVDTCGFSLCDFKGIRSDELRLYLDDFVELSHGCKFTSCTHTVEPDCAVKLAVEQGRLCNARYERYLEEYRELVEIEKKQY
ncbi:MAG: ribosome small subunit-dependent GTPase A [Clostridiales bacterium]|nr:ribosome small subunit-dependent GTPase A [Clostridiales bacterium]